MKTAIFTFDGLTSLGRAKRILQKNGIKSNPIKLVGDGKRTGCTYALEFKSSYYPLAVDTLRGSGIGYGVYRI